MEVIATRNFQPDIVLNGMRIGEPVIVLTGLLVALVSLYAWRRLVRLGAPKYERLFFLFLGVSTIIGAMVGHCFLYALPFESKMPGWFLGMLSVAAFAQAGIERAAALTGPVWRRNLSILNLVLLAGFMAWVGYSLWFPGVEIHSALGFLGIITPLETIIYLRGGVAGERRRDSALLLRGILFLVAAVLMHILKISAGVWFSYFDIAHLFMCAAVWMFMLGFEAAPERRLVTN